MRDNSYHILSQDVNTLIQGILDQCDDKLFHQTEVMSMTRKSLEQHLTFIVKYWWKNDVMKVRKKIPFWVSYVQNKLQHNVVL